MSKHLKRYAAPKSWKIKRKTTKYITKPSPGSHSANISLPLNVVLRGLLNYASSNREVKYMINNKDILVDGIRRKDYRFPVGLFDIFSINDIDEHLRIIIGKDGRLELIKISKDESKLKPCKIIGKTALKGKIQLNLFDGKNLLVDKTDYKVGDTILLSINEKESKVKEHVKLAKDSLIYLTGGRHIGQIGKVQDIISTRIIYKTEDGGVVETLKKYAFPIGKDKPLIQLVAK